MDTIEFMKEIDDKVVDLIICDLPYGTTSCSWDVIIPFEELWSQYKRIIKDDGTIVLFSSQPFTTKLINSNIKNFKYCWVWNKKLAGNGIIAKIQPLKIHEDICVFAYGKGRYFPKMRKGKYRKKNGIEDKHGTFSNAKSEITENDDYYPESILTFSGAGERSKRIHPTQKPVSLFRYLIETYTNTGDLVVDNCVGSGTTSVACKQLNRNFLCCDNNPSYIELANQRLSQGVLHAFFQTQGVLTEPSPNRNLKDLSSDKSQISANAETSLNSDIKQLKGEQNEN
jgi:site-specific DNA-methyltransferase (adenine-specific)